jgi:hypothetical protein
MRRGLRSVVKNKSSTEPGFIFDSKLEPQPQICQHERMHSRFASLGGIVRKTAAKSTATVQRAPSRRGKKGVTFYLQPEVVRQLRSIGLEEDKTLQALMIEAANMLFKSRGKAEIAK